MNWLTDSFQLTETSNLIIIHVSKAKRQTLLWNKIGVAFRANWNAMALHTPPEGVKFQSAIQNDHRVLLPKGQLTDHARA